MSDTYPFFSAKTDPDSAFGIQNSEQKWLLLQIGTEGASSPNFYAVFILASAQFKAARFAEMESTVSQAFKFIDKVTDT